MSSVSRPGRTFAKLALVGPDQLLNCRIRQASGAFAGVLRAM